MATRRFGAELVITDKGLAILDKAGVKVGQLGKEITSTAKKTEVLSTKAVALGTFLGGAALKGVEKLIGGLKSLGGAAVKWVELSNIQEDAIKKLNVAMKSSGEFSNAAAAEMQAFASELQDMTGIGDEATLEMLALAKGFGQTNEQAKLMTQAAVDFAESADLNVTEALRRLGRALGGSRDDISKFVPEVLKLTKAQLAAGEATRLVAERFAGAASAGADTFSGDIKKLTASVSDLGEDLGDVIKSGLRPFSEVLLLLTENVSTFIAAHKAEILKVFTSALLFMVDASLLAVKSAGSMARAYGEVRLFFAEALGALKPLIQATALLALAHETLNKNTIRISGALFAMVEGLDANIKDQSALATGIDETTKAIEAQAVVLRNKLAEGLDIVNEKAQAAAEAEEELGETIKKTPPFVKEATERFFSMGEVLNAVREGTLSAADAMEKYGVSIVDTAKKGAAEISKFAKEIQALQAVVFTREIGGRETVKFEEGEDLDFILSRLKKLSGETNQVASGFVKSFMQNIASGDISALKDIIQALTNQAAALISSGAGFGKVSAAGHEFEGLAFTLNQIMGDLRKITDAPGRAFGGPVLAGRSVLVGELGQPEIFTPKESGTITPMGRGMSFGSGFEGDNQEITGLLRSMLGAIRQGMKIDGRALNDVINRRNARGEGVRP